MILGCVHMRRAYTLDMPKPKQADRSTVAELNITFRATRATRAKLDALISAAQKKVAAAGGDVTLGSYMRSLIEREAAAEGITGETEPAPAGLSAADQKGGKAPRKPARSGGPS
jgi:hypothetical protein